LREAEIANPTSGARRYVLVESIAPDQPIPSLALIAAARGPAGMSRPKHPIAWACAATLLAGVAVIAGVRLFSTWHGGPAPAVAGDGRGIIAATDSPSDPGTLANGQSLASLARRIRLLQEGLNDTRGRLAKAETEAALLRDRAATLDRMLAGDSLTDCPLFLHDETTVRALQGILREAAAGGTDAAATIARQRLRQRLAGLRDQMAQEADDREAEADALHGRLRQQADDLETLQQSLMSRLSEAQAGPGNPAP
jgi:hypothetical protein